MTQGRLIDIADKVSNIVNELYITTEKSRIDDVFDKYGISNLTERIDLLRRCMKVLDISNAPGAVTLQDEYKGEIEIFAEGSWRFIN